MNSFSRKRLARARIGAPVAGSGRSPALPAISRCVYLSGFSAVLPCWNYIIWMLIRLCDEGNCIGCILLVARCVRNCEGILGSVRGILMVVGGFLG